MATTVAFEQEARINAPAGEPVRRSVLVERLIGAPDAALVILVAPPGYGKTTLLSE